jgi:hypothetical protein
MEKLIESFDRLTCRANLYDEANSMLAQTTPVTAGPHQTLTLL